MTVVDALKSAPEGEMLYALHNVVKTRSAGEVSFSLRVPELRIHQGEKIALIGESGCGKSTLLDLLAFILEPSSAAAFQFLDMQRAQTVDFAAYWNRDKLNRLTALRKLNLGYVMQTGGLLPFLTVREYICLSRKILGMPCDSSVDDLVSELGLSRHLDKLPDALSTGERQRVAIGRALAHKPSIVIADEPTASVDPFAAEKIMSLFIGLVEELNITVIVASHAWRHIKQLGLRRLAHHTRRSTDGKTTETIVSG